MTQISLSVMLDSPDGGSSTLSHMLSCSHAADPQICRLAGKLIKSRGRSSPTSRELRSAAPRIFRCQSLSNPMIIASVADTTSLRLRPHVASDHRPIDTDQTDGPTSRQTPIQSPASPIDQVATTAPWPKKAHAPPDVSPQPLGSGGHGARSRASCALQPTPTIYGTEISAPSRNNVGN